MLNIAITFDYELFLGRNLAESKDVLFEPTERIINLLNSYGVTSTFFADICSVFAHKKSGLKEYVDDFEAQLKRMILTGHDVQLHIHPNWLLSNYTEGEWIFDTTHYRIHNFGFDADAKTSAQSIIHGGKQYLEDLLQNVCASYKCIAYRAGGYSVQPHQELFQVLMDEGIIIDSSVCAKQFADTSANKYDFRRSPNATNWWI